MYLIQYDLDGQWTTCATRGGFATAKAKARAEYRAMRAERDVSIIREGDPELLRRMMEDNFELRATCLK